MKGSRAAVLFYGFRQIRGVEHSQSQRGAGGLAPTGSRGHSLILFGEADLQTLCLRKLWTAVLEDSGHEGRFSLTA